MLLYQRTHSDEVGLLVAGEFRLAPSADLDFRPTLTYCFRKYPSTCELNCPQRVVNSTCLKTPPNPLKPFASESTPNLPFSQLLYPHVNDALKTSLTLNFLNH